MKKLALSIFNISLIAGLCSLFATSHQSNELKYSLDEIRTKLESEETIERSAPIIERNFIPYLGDKWIGQAVSYGCYRKGQAPGKLGPDKEEILEDLNIIKQYWNLIRVYNADEDTQRILEVIRENNLPIKMMLGVWLENEENNKVAKKNNITNIMRCIELVDKYPKIITAVNVGNETQVFWSGHKIDSNTLIKYIRVVRNYTSIPVTTADDYNYWNRPESNTVADEVDFIVTHAYPLWNGKTMDNALDWLDKTFNDLKQMHPRKVLILGEVGWATNYNPDKKGEGEQGSLIKGEVSVKAQERFLIELDKWVNEKKVITFLFEVFDEPWKGGGDDSDLREIEKNWGVFYHNRTPKLSFSNYLTKKELKE